MTMRLSPHKVSKMLRGYFHGLPQIKIAQSAAVNQGSISHYASRFKERAAIIGISAAGKEFGVFNEVDELRSLSVELYNSCLTPAEARKGVSIIKAFLKLGIDPEQHLAVIKVCQEVANPHFVDAAIKLDQIEAKTGMDYNQVISSFEKAQNELPQLEAKATQAKAELKSTDNAILKKKQELTKQEEYLEQYKEVVKARVTELEKELSAKMKQMGVKKNEVEEIAALKKYLVEKGLNLQKLLNLGKEFSHESKGN